MSTSVNSEVSSLSLTVTRLCIDQRAGLSSQATTSQRLLTATQCLGYCDNAIVEHVFNK